MQFVNLTLTGISNGMIYAAVALALVLIWRATRIINFAQGAMLMFTTFVAKAVIDQTGSYWWGFVAALACGFAFGAFVELVIVRPVENKPPLNAVIVTLGLLILIQAGAGMLFGVTPESFPPAFGIRGYVLDGQRLLFTSTDLFIVLSILGLALVLLLLFRGTTLGLQMRASAFEPEVAVASQQSVQALLATIGALPVRCRQAFMLHKFEGLSHAEVAEQMGISVKMVEKHIKMGLQACRGCLAQQETASSPPGARDASPGGRP